MSRVALAVFNDPRDAERSAALARHLALPLIDAAAQAPPDCIGWLRYGDGRLQLQPADPRQSGPVLVDFCAGANAHRLQGGAELVVKAVRGRSREALRVLDATAGLGRDSFVLASRGFEVCMLERSPAIAALLADGLERARAAPAAIADIAARLSLIEADAAVYFNALTDAGRPDVIYLDPMFPAAQKSALVKKEMRLFQQLLHGEADDGAALLRAARACARLRVVVKRPLRAPFLGGAEASYALAGKAVRFDVYAG